MKLLTVVFIICLLMVLAVIPPHVAFYAIAGIGFINIFTSNGGHEQK